MTTGAPATSDVPLSGAGKERAEVLKSKLQEKDIRHIYATPTIRARSTAMPLSDALKIGVTNYNVVDSLFINKLKKLKGSVLIVGHSNTVDDLVNGLTGKSILKDLPDASYGDLFIIEKRGERFIYSKDHFGK